MSMRRAPRQTATATEEAEDVAEEQEGGVTAAVDTPAEAENNLDHKHPAEERQRPQVAATVESAWLRGLTRTTPSAI